LEALSESAAASFDDSLPVMPPASADEDAA
jgi:hypothetical protein